MTLVFMLEELSMKQFLEGLLPRILPEGMTYLLIPHEGKTDLEKSLRIKLRAWRAPDSHFIVVRDQDSGDCHIIKARLRKICDDAGRPDTMIRIVCRELEAWFIADLDAVGRAFEIDDLARQKTRRSTGRRTVSALQAGSSRLWSLAMEKSGALENSVRSSRSTTIALRALPCSSLAFAVSQQPAARPCDRFRQRPGTQTRGLTSLPSPDR